MKTLETILRISMLIGACILLITYYSRVETPTNTEILIMAFGMALLARVEAINNKI